MELLNVQSRKIEMKNACVHFMFSYQNKDVAQMMSFCDPEGEVFFSPLGEAGRGKIGELGKNLWTLLIDCFPNINNTIDAIVSEGDLVRCQVLISGTQAKDFAGIPNKGKTFNSDHIFIFHLNRTNKIDQIEIQWNHEDFVKQLSA
ncbi:ester cyclase [Adhaeribacter radiodurans]|uniref:Ester cyclase n=1 Tax=Adhaeribacter radiodurans TaxID=2745197 RepID=A0A7L7LBP0_9BACT|nr:ester cyclase [Adhaeribacter radiodurans]QMU29955.1 ester cyclase [Adhaeribacter radiodurans]